MVNEEVTMMLSVVPGVTTGISTMMSGLVSINNAFMDMTRQLDANFGLIDTSIITTATVVAQLGISAAQSFGEFEQGLKVAQMVSGQTAQEMDYLRQKANEFSVSYRADIDQITEGLQTLGRAGLNSASEQTEVLENGLSTAKLEGRELNSVLEELIQNTALLGGNLKESNFGEDSGYVNDLLVATSMSAPITTHDVSETLKYSGGIAAAAGARVRDEQGNEDIKGKEILEDYMGAIAAFAQKGVTGSIAGTALRAFFNKPATQDSSVTEALSSIQLKPEYLWEEDEETMKPVSEQIGIIQGQMEKLNISTMDRLQIWSKIVGGKMGQQMMKLDSSDIKELTSDIRAADDAGSLAAGTFQTFQSKMKETTEQGQVAFRQFGEYAAKALTPILEIAKRILEFFSNPIVSGAVFVGAFSLISAAAHKLINVFSVLKSELAQVKRAFLGGEELYAMRPSIERSMNRKGRSYNDNREIGEYFKTRTGERTIGKAALEKRKAELEDNLLKQGATPEDLGATLRLGKVPLEEHFPYWKEDSAKEKIKMFKGFKTELGLDHDFSFKGEDMARYALKHGLWEDKDTDYLMSTDKETTVQDFARQRGVSLYERVFEHMGSVILKKPRRGAGEERPFGKDISMHQNINRILDYFNVYGGDSSGTNYREEARQRLTKLFVENQMDGSNLTFDQLREVFHTLQDSPGVTLSDTFFNEMSAEMAKKRHKKDRTERIKGFIRKGEYNTAAGYEASSKNPRVDFYDLGVLESLKNTLSIADDQTLDDFRRVKKEIETGLEDRKVEMFTSYLSNIEGGMHQTTLLSSSSFAEFADKVAGHGANSTKYFEEWIKLIYTHYGLNDDYFEMVQDSVLVNLGQEEGQWKDILDAERRAKQGIPKENVQNKKKNHYIENLDMTFNDLRKHVEGLDENKYLVSAVEYLMDSRDNEDLKIPQLSRQSAMHHIYQEAQRNNSDYFSATLSGFDGLPEGFSVPMEEALFYDNGPIKESYFRDIELQDGTPLKKFIRKQFGTRDAEILLPQMYQAYVEQVNQRRAELNDIVSDEIQALNDIMIAGKISPGSQLKTGQDVTSLKRKNYLLEIQKMLGLKSTNGKILTAEEIYNYVTPDGSGVVNEDILRSLNPEEITGLDSKNRTAKLRTLASLLGINSGGTGDDLERRLLLAQKHPELYLPGKDNDNYAKIAEFIEEQRERNAENGPDVINWEEFVDFINFAKQEEKERKEYAEAELERLKEKKEELSREQKEKLKKESELHTPGNANYEPTSSQIQDRQRYTNAILREKEIEKTRREGLLLNEDELFQSRLQRKLEKHQNVFESGYNAARGRYISDRKQSKMPITDDYIDSFIENVTNQVIDNIVQGEELSSAWKEYYEKHGIPEGSNRQTTHHVSQVEKERDKYKDIIDSKERMSELPGVGFVIEQPIAKRGSNKGDEYVWDTENFQRSYDAGLGLRGRIGEKFSSAKSGLGDALKSFLYHGLENPKAATGRQKLTASITNLTSLAGGPLMVAIEAATAVITMWQQAYEQYTEDLKKASESLSEAYSKWNSAEDALKRTYREGNPDATDDEIDQMMYDTYSTMEEDMANAFNNGSEEYFKKLNTKAEQGRELVYDEEKDDGTTVEKEEEEVDEQTAYEEAIKENTGALYAATAELGNALDNYTRKATDSWWGVDGGVTWLSDQIGGLMDKATHSATGGSTFSENGNQFLLTQSQADDNYAGYKEMAGLMLEDFKDANGNWIKGLRTMMGKDVEMLANIIPKGSYNALKSRAEFASRLGPQANMKIQQSMKNDPKTWKKLGKELAKRDVNKKAGRSTDKNMKRINGMIARLNTSMKSGFRDVDIMQAAYLQQMQDMYQVAQQSIVPIIAHNAQTAASTLYQASNIGSNVNGTGSNTGGTYATAGVIAGLVAIIAKAEAAKASYQTALEGSTELGATDVNGDGSPDQKDVEIVKLARDSDNADDFYKKAMGKYDLGNQQTGIGRFNGSDSKENMQAAGKYIAQMYEATALMTGYGYDAKTANEKAKEYINNTDGMRMTDIMNTAAKNYTENPRFRQALIDNYLASDDGDGDGSGGGGGGGGGGGDSGDKDNTGTKKERVDLVLCNKKEIPKLNVNLFKKPPSFTVLNKNFKLRDVKINTQDTPKAVMASIKNAFIDVQKRSDPKIIQDEEAAYDPVEATDGNAVPSGSAKTKTD